MTTFVYPAFPLTPVLVIVGCVVVVAIAGDEGRRFLVAWIALAILLALNPMSAQVLLGYFRGIYYRLVYLLPFPLCLGLSAAYLYDRHRSAVLAHRHEFVAIVGAAALALAVLVPVSLFRLSLYAWGNPLYEGDIVRATGIVKAAPPGNMLAAYPLSGAISMLDSDVPQMLARPDLLDFYLRAEGDDTDADLRSQAQLMLDGDPAAGGAMEDILEHHPEIQSIVLKRQVYLSERIRLDPVLDANGFSKRSASIPGILIFSR